MVADTGHGIAAEHLGHVFDRFYRVDAARDRTHGGSGIGLSIAKALVEAHGGGISVASAGAGKGAVFTVRLPTAEAQAPADR
jgi:signal transduction histidine kinase